MPEGLNRRSLVTVVGAVAGAGVLLFAACESRGGARGAPAGQGPSGASGAGFADPDPDSRAMALRSGLPGGR
jgi:hypothetical protein